MAKAAVAKIAEEVLSIKSPTTMPVSYLKLGESIYTLNRITAKLDIEKELKEFFVKSVDKVKKEAASTLAENIETDWKKQRDKLIEISNSTRVTLSRDLWDKLVFYRQGNKKILRVEPVLFHPVVFYLDKDNVGLFDEEAREKISPFFRDIRSTTSRCRMIVQNNIYIPGCVGFDDANQRVYAIGLMTFHTFTDGKMCIGNSPYPAYAELKGLALSEQISEVNMFSLATHTLLQGITLSNCVGSVVSVEVAEGSRTWRTA